MDYICENSVQGWKCPSCNWEILTTYIAEMYQDMTYYSIYVKNMVNIDNNKIKVISKIAGVNYLDARQMLIKGDMCVLKAKAVEIKSAVEKLQKAGISFEVIPKFNY